MTACKTPTSPAPPEPIDVHMTEEAFRQLMARIEALGYHVDTAACYASLIGDTPTFDDDGRVVVWDLEGTELARLRLDI
jgi:hypothetical protein